MRRGFLYDLGVNLKDEPWQPVTAGRIQRAESQDRSIFSVIRERALMVHHPYESFASSVEAFLAQAADDPKVQSIKMTLYRAGGDSPIARSLIRAAERGVQVAVLVELKARFDEATNVGWARALEGAGVHVVYGLVGLKTHAKLSMVVRRDADRIRRYCHIGTGNYNSRTAQRYEDFGLFSADEQIGDDLIGWRGLAIAGVTGGTGVLALYHGFAHTHMDSLCHMFYEGKMFNGFAKETIDKQGASKLSIHGVKNGIFTRGILMDIPRLKGVKYLEPKTPIYPEDLEAWEKQAGVKVSSGDVVFIRTGRWARRAEKGAWNVGSESAGCPEPVRDGAAPRIRAHHQSLQRFYAPARLHEPSRQFVEQFRMRRAFAADAGRRSGRARGTG